MLFEDKELKNYVFCNVIAKLLANYYFVLVIKNKEINTFPNSSVSKRNNHYISKDYIFGELKIIVFKIEELIGSIDSNDIKNNVKSLFIPFNEDIEGLDVEINNKEMSIAELSIVIENFQILILKFYNFIEILFDDQGFIFKGISDVVFKTNAILILNSLRKIKVLFPVESSNNDNKILYDRVVLLEENLKKLTKEVNINSAQIIKTIDGFVLAKEEHFDKQLNDLIERLRVSLSSIHNEYENEVKGKVEKLYDSVLRTDLDFQKTFNDYNQLKGLVNIKGEMLITDHYKKRAFWERITYWLMTIGTFAIIIWSICLALNGLDEYKAKTNISISAMVQQYKDQPVDKIEKMYSVIQSNALIYLVLRLIFSVLLFSSIIYTSRVAYRAYVHMRHSENMMLKLATLRPFINQLEEDDRNQIHKDLVPDYFGKDAGMVDSTNEKFKDLPANVSAIAMKAIEQISGGGSNCSTEKNNKKPEGETG